MSKRPTVFVGSVIAIVIAAVLSALVLTKKAPAPAANSTLPSAVTRITQFTPYMFQVLDGFKVDNASASYSQGVLVFRLVGNGNQTIAVTEQPLPTSVQTGLDPHATQVTGADGSAIITFNDTNTSAALFGNAHHGVQTMVLLNVTSPISQSTIEDLLRGLRAIR